MSFDAHKNFAYSTVATAPSPASSGTSLVVQAGDGAKFPAVPFNATVWPAGFQPLTTNAEIVRVTAKSTDTLTITRAQESSSARSIVAGDQIAATITAKVITDIEASTAIGSTVIDYVEKDLTSSGGTATVSGHLSDDNTAPVFIQGNTITVDGSTQIAVEFFLAASEPNVGDSIGADLWDGSTFICSLCDSSTSVGATGRDATTLYGRRFLTPSAGSHTYAIRLWCVSDTGTGSGTIYSGTNSVGSPAPATWAISYYRVSRGDGAGPVGATGATGSPGGATGATGPTGATGASGTAGLVKIFESTLGVAAASIDTGAAGVGSGHGDLIIYITARTAKAANTDLLVLTLNADTATNYDRVYLDSGGNGASLSEAGALMGIPAANFTANVPGTFKIVIPAYDKTTFFKSINWEQGHVSSLANDKAAETTIWKNTAAVTRVTATGSGGNLIAGSRMVIYGTQ